MNRSLVVLICVALTCTSMLQLVSSLEQYVQRNVISDDIKARVAAMSIEQKVGQTLQLDIVCYVAL
jgi:CHASE1-domain containing sensor protein